MSRARAVESSGQRYSLILTGERRGRRRRVSFNGHDGLLADEPFEALCELLYAKATGQDSVSLSRQVVGRIRRGLGEPPRAEGKPSVIESRGKGRYAVVLPSASISLDRSFVEQSAEDLPPRYRERVMRRAFRATSHS